MNELDTKSNNQEEVNDKVDNNDEINNEEVNNEVQSEVTEDLENQTTDHENSEQEQNQETDEDELKAKQEAYKERIRKRQEERKQISSDENQQNLRESADQSEENSRIKYLEQVAAQMQYNQQINVAKKELASLENEFIEAYPDYKESVDSAIDFVKLNLIKQGMSEADALAQIEHERILLADEAVRKGQDPVDVLYKEAKLINDVIDEYATKRGYTKTKPVNLNNERKINKPSAIGSGYSSQGVKVGLNEDGNNEIQNMTLQQMLEAKASGAL